MWVFFETRQRDTGTGDVEPKLCKLQFLRKASMITVEWAGSALRPVVSTSQFPLCQACTLGVCYINHRNLYNTQGRPRQEWAET